MSTPSWYPDERLHAGDEHLDPEYVATYDRKAQTDPADDLARLPIWPDSILVDIGAGTGTFALAAAALCRKVIAVDVSPHMMDVLRRSMREQGIDNIETHEAGFLSYEHHGDPADIVYSRHALHHLPDFWKAIALRRIHDLLKPGGIFMLRDLVYSFDPDEADAVIESWLAGAASSPDAGWTRAELETHLKDEYSPFSWLLEPMLERAGFLIEDVTHHGSIYSTYICRRPE
ncbi:MAG TPA: methyltransferase domain-containing protein [Thermomicrobiales bacterium]|nr:methyltransferase domain-containing protein [Thermomicrobiales bacterium]